MGNGISEIRIEEFDYNLPEEQVAKYPLEDRTACKLLYYNAKENHLQDGIFHEIGNILPPHCLLVMNNSRVIHARIFMERATGSKIEIFCLNPITPGHFEEALACREKTVWQCLVGNSKKWKEKSLNKVYTMPDGAQVTLTASREDGDPFQITFTWDDKNYTFGEILEAIGKLPIPPYLHRESEESDNKDYQTVYAKPEGSVAAPTAGLHFTQPLLQELEQKGFGIEYVTLHVGAGTFLPVKSSRIEEHTMHSEVCTVSLNTIEKLLEHPHDTVAIGTTSVRTLESLYYLATHHLEEIKTYCTAQILPHINQWEPYQPIKNEVSDNEALQQLCHTMKQLHLQHISYTTSLIIVPGYKFHYCNGMVTNFHQPKSTLLLMVSAFIGEAWEMVYQHALEHNYRFLSYGDASFYVRKCD